MAGVIVAMLRGLPALVVVLAVLGGAACRGRVVGEPPGVEVVEPAAVAEAPTRTAEVVPSETEAAPSEPEVASSEPEAPSEPEAAPSEPEAAPPEPAARFVPTPCARKCKRVQSETCVTRERPSAEPEALGCGAVSPSGRLAMLHRTQGGGSAGLVYEIIDLEGTTLHLDERSCPELEAWDCEDPGTFLALAEDGWLHRMGNAGDGTNDQALWNVVTREIVELPDGEYDVVVHPGGERVGLFALVPNQRSGGWHATLACVDVAGGELHRVWRARLSEEKADRYLVAELSWDGDALVLRDDGKRLRRAVCPPEPKEAPAEPAPVEPSAGG